ncbi:MAG: hypothetical protein AB1640_09330 [bacterium]
MTLNRRGGQERAALGVLMLALLAIVAACGTGGLSGEAEMRAADGGGGGGSPGGSSSGNWTIQVVDTNANAGQQNTLRIDSQGRMFVSYFAGGSPAYWIRQAAFDGWSWEIETVYETDTNTGCSVALDGSGRPAIAFVGGGRQPLYYWPFQSDLLLASSDGGAWQWETVDETGVVGLWASVAFDRFGRPGISYQDLGNGIDYTDFHWRDLKFAQHTPDGWDVETLEPDGGGYYSQLVFDSDGQPAVAYCGNLDGESQPVKFARRGDTGWELYTIDAVGKCAEASLSLRSRLADRFGIAYYDDRTQDLKYADFFGGVWHLETVEAHNQVGKYCSLAFGPDGQPVISYYYCGRTTDQDCQGGGDLRIARRTDAGWVVENVETSGNTGLFTSLEITPRGETFIAYQDQTLNALKIAVQR